MQLCHETSLKVTYSSYSVFETPEEFYTAVSMDQRACSFWALLTVTLLGRPHTFSPLCPCAEKLLPDFPGSQMPSPGGNLLGSQRRLCLCAGLHPGTYHVLLCYFLLLCYFSFPLEFIKDRTLSLLWSSPLLSLFVFSFPALPSFLETRSHCTPIRPSAPALAKC